MITKTKNRPFKIPHGVTYEAARLWAVRRLERFFYAQTRAERRLMGKEYYKYNLTGTVKFSVGNIFFDNSGRVTELVEGEIRDSLSGNIKGMIVKSVNFVDVKQLRPATEEEIEKWIPEED